MNQALVFYLDHARQARERAVEALNSDRKDRLAIARQHFKRALAALAEARFEAMTRQ